MALKRSGPPRRKSALRSSGRPTGRNKPIKKANRKRRASEFERAYGSKARVAWIQWLPSIVSGERPCANAHVRNGGAGRKADAKWIVPLTDAEHRELHRMGAKSFEARHGINLEVSALNIEGLWQTAQIFALAGHAHPKDHGAVR